MQKKKKKCLEGNVVSEADISKLTMEKHSYLHGKGLAAARMSADEGALLFMEWQYVALQVERSGVRARTSISGAVEHNTLLRVNMLMLLQEPAIPERFLTLITLYPDWTHKNNYQSNVL